MTTPETPEKWEDWTEIPLIKGGHQMVISPAWASHMEALVKEFAEATKVEAGWKRANGSCIHCMGRYVGKEFKFEHDASCPVLKAQKVLAPSPTEKGMRQSETKGI